MADFTVIEPAKVHGVWAVALLPWDADWQLDVASFHADLDHVIARKPDGFYTLDTASEFYTLEFADWLRVAQMFVSHCRAAGATMPLGLGCTWTNQAGALDRIRAARDLGVDTIHLSAPYWAPLDTDGLRNFYAAAQEAAGHLGIVIYAPPWTAINLDPALYRALRDVAPNIIGSKTVAQYPELFEMPGSHFTGEPRLFEAYKLGATGTYSALAGISVSFVQHWISLMRDGDWDAASEINDRLQKFYAEGVVPCREAGVTNGANDKAMAQIGGAVGSRAMRPPYKTMPDDLYNNLEAAARKYLPEAFA